MNKPALLVLGLTCLLASQAYAQPASTKPAVRPSNATQQQAQVPPAKPATTAEQDRGRADVTTASFDDWQMTCRPAPVAAGQPGRRRCEVLQSIVVQGQSAPFAQLGFGKLAPGEPLYFTAVVPPNVALPSNVKMATAENDKQPVEMAWTRCLPGGCFASVAMKDDVLKRWRAQNEGGRLLFKNGAGQDLVVPVSLKGLARALDALGMEN